MIQALQTNLGEFASLIREQNGDALHQRMTKAKQARDNYIARFEPSQSAGQH